MKTLYPVLAISVLAFSSSAANRHWLGNASTDFADGDNWKPAGDIAATDALMFLDAGVFAPTLAAPLSTASLQIYDADVTFLFGANTLSLSGGILLNSPTSTDLTSRFALLSGTIVAAGSATNDYMIVDGEGSYVSCSRFRIGGNSSNCWARIPTAPPTPCSASATGRSASGPATGRSTCAGREAFAWRGRTPSPRSPASHAPTRPWNSSHRRTPPSSRPRTVHPDPRHRLL